ncbi:MAG: 30S ribosomal protein S5 [Candidatus Aenigmarchaeota archaeon]|nr:30S ribosomal protein S5 [Candidatus Aenigmarchaeota archaeon]
MLAESINKQIKAKLSEWAPKTSLGKKVLEGKIKSIDEIFPQGEKIKEPEIIDYLIPNLQVSLIEIGGTPGKGGGQRRTPTKRTVRMHRSGRRYKISAMAVVGDGNGHVGVGRGSAKDHRAAVEKAIQNAKLNIIPVRRGCGSWECSCSDPHSIDKTVEGKSGSVRIVLIPAPRGLGLCCSEPVKEVMKAAGIKDIWVKTFGDTRTRENLILATFNAFKNLNKMRK